MDGLSVAAFVLATAPLSGTAGTEAVAPTDSSGRASVTTATVADVAGVAADGAMAAGGASTDAALELATATRSGWLAAASVGSALTTLGPGEPATGADAMLPELAGVPATVALKSLGPPAGLLALASPTWESPERATDFVAATGAVIGAGSAPIALPEVPWLPSTSGAAP